MGEQFEKAVKLSELRKATKQCRRNVMWKDSVAGFSNHSLLRCKQLRDEILAGKYRISPYVTFKVHEPKERDILATRIRDRVLQRSLCNNGVYDDMTRSFIYDNGACMRERGTDHAIRRLECFLQQFYREYGDNKGYAVHMDVHHYFPDTPHEAAKQTVRERVRDAQTVPYIENIIDSFPDRRDAEEIEADPYGRRGTGLGSQMSQLIQLALLDKVDHALKERFGVCWYIRYMDDFVLICRDKAKLEETMAYITQELEKLGLSITSKGGIFKLPQGTNFLKLRFILTDTGKVIIRLNRKAPTRERKQLRNMKALLDAGKVTMDDVERHYQSWIGHAMRADADGIIREMDRFYTQLFRKRPNYKYKRRGKHHVQKYAEAAPGGAPGERSAAGGA